VTGVQTCALPIYRPSIFGQLDHQIQLLYDIESPHPEWRHS